jgi:hypothetical protein
MEVTELESCKLLHDGDYDGAMYLRPLGLPEDRGIVVTRAMLEYALRNLLSDALTVVLRGPKESEHDRHDPILEPGAGALKAGPWVDGEVEAKREDIETIVMRYRTSRIAQFASNLQLPDLPFDELLRDLDAIECELEAITGHVPTSRG